MKAQPKLIVVGAGGRLGAALLRELSREYQVLGFTHAELDLAKPESLAVVLEPLKFEAMINAAALTNVDYCEDHQDEAFRINAQAPAVLAQICQAKGARFLHVSTDYVFDGEKRSPYSEEDNANPISVYGASKREGEVKVLAANAAAWVIRVSWVFGPDRPSFVDAVLAKARTEEKVAAVADKFSTPTYTRDIAELVRPLLSGEFEPDINQKDGRGILHLANRGACSWQEYAQWALDCCHAAAIPMRARQVDRLSLGEMKNFVARRPVYTVLSTGKYERLTGRAPRAWQTAVEEYVREKYGTGKGR